MLYATARGLVEMHLNGARVGDAVLAPGWTDYRKRIEYAAHDVTELLADGANVLGGDPGRRLVLGLRRLGPQARRRPLRHLSRAALRAAPRVRGRHARGGGERRAVARRPPGRSATRTCCTASTTTPAASSTAGWTRLRRQRLAARADAGARRRGARARARAADPRDGGAAAGVRDRARARRPRGRPRPEHGRLGPARGRGRARHDACGCASPRCSRTDGSLHVANLRSARPQETYVLRGGGREVFEPRFTLPRVPLRRGAGARGGADARRPRRPLGHAVDRPVRVLERAGQPAVAQRHLGAARQLPVGSDGLPAARRAARLARPTRRSSSPSAALNMDVAAFITKWGDDILDAQSPDGAYPDVAPRLGAERDGAPAWGDAGIIVPWTIYERYGDVRILERHWDAMERYVAHLVRHNPDLLWTSPAPQRLRRLAVGRRRHAARGARDRVPGVRREAHGPDRDGARTSRPSGPLRAAAPRCRRRLQPRLRARGRLHRRRHADGLPAGVAHGPAPGRAARAGGGAAGRRHRAPRLASHDRLHRRRPAVSRADRGRATPTSPTGSCSTRRSRPGATRSATARPRSGSAGTAGPRSTASRPR